MTVRILFVLAMGLLLAGCSSISTPSNEASKGGRNAYGVMKPAPMGTSLPAPNFSPSTSDIQYRLGALDVVNVLVFQVPELSGDFQVGSDGMLALPLVGSVRAAGRTVQDVQKDITTRLQASYLQSPQVSVKVTGFNSQRVTVDGAVLKPGVFPVSGSATLLDYIALAGGLPRTADPSNIAIFRKIDGTRMAARFNVTEIRDGKAQDPIVYGGDTIVVPTSGVRSAWSDFLSAMPVASFAATAAGL